jgi:hypothetical protein
MSGIFFGKLRWVTWEWYQCGDTGFPPIKERKLQQFIDGKWGDVESVPLDSTVDAET